MMKQIYGLKYDYIDNHGTYLLLDSEEGLKSENLAEIEAKMIQFNKIPRLLDLDVEERDFLVQLRYNISGKKMLSHLFKGQKISLNQYFQLLHKIASTLEDSKTYMLNEQNYIIQEDFIFVGQDITDIYLTYVPLKKGMQPVSTRDEIKALATNIIGSIESIQGNSFQTLMNYFKEDSFSISGLKKLLQSLLHHNDDQGEPALQPRKIENIQPPHALNNNNEKEIAKPIAEKKKPVEHSFPKVTPLKQNLVKANTEKQLGQEKSSIGERKLEPLTQRGLVYLWCAVVLGSAFIWSSYLDYPSEGSLYISLGLTLLLLDVAFILMYVWRPGEKSDSSRGVQSAQTPEPRNMIQPKIGAKPEPKPQSSPNQVKNVFPPIQEVAVGAEVPSPAQYYQNLAEKTTLLSGRDETVLLSSDVGPPPQQNQPKAYLQLERGGRTERIDITTSSFVIGRNPQTAHYVDNSNGISRAHFEIIEKNQVYFIKDLSSKNGTNLNGHKLTPHKEMELKSGDVITIGQEVKYVFKK